MASFRQYVQAHDVLQCGGVIAYPTEAVYGYGCDPFNEEAVDRLLSIKRRPWQKGLILIAANTGQVAPLLDPLTQEQREMVESSWPGPVTWLLPDPHHWVPVGIKGQFDSVAVRVTDHPITKQLCERWKGPLVSTSANRTGQPPCYHEWPLRLRLQRAPEVERPDFIVGGATGGRSKPSQIRDLLTGDLVRS